MTKTYGVADRKVLVIAHRGACGYLPEHTLEAKAYAHATGADYLEQDIVATRDDELIVLHDIHLDRVTDVRARFPDRQRSDGRYYARDFDLHEIRTLVACERRADDGVSAVFPTRFPDVPVPFRVPTFRDELCFIRGLNRSTGREVGVYPEIKRPAWHREQGVDISPLVLDLLDEFGYRSKSDPVYLQCFDAEELRRIRHDLGCGLKLVQLLADNSWGESATDYAALQTRQGLHELAQTADGIGPWFEQLAAPRGDGGLPVPTRLAADAHAEGLTVHPYTFRADQLAAGFNSMQEMVRWSVETLHIDGLFSDFPELALAALGA